MSAHSEIQWTDATWNPVVGCDRVSPGCMACYAVRDAWRMGCNPNPKVSSVYRGLVERQSNGQLDWTGEIRTLPERLGQPLRWRDPKRIFVNSQSDLFHEAVPDEFIDQVFAIMTLTPQHTYQILTKRPDRMRRYLRERIDATDHFMLAALADIEMVLSCRLTEWKYNLEAQSEDVPLGLLDWSHVWLGVSVEDQKRADERIPLLLQTPAPVRFLSCEPLLARLDLWEYLLANGGPDPDDGEPVYYQREDEPRIHWVIVGGESTGLEHNRLVEPCECTTYAGHSLAKPWANHQDCWGTGWAPKLDALRWVRSLRDQCQAAGVPFCFKQWGGPTPKSGGRVLDGRTWEEFP